MNIDLLRQKVENEYQQGFNHIRQKRDAKRDVLQKLLPQDIPNWQVRVNLLWKNLQLERALFVSDKLSVKYLSNDNVLWKEIMENANKVIQYDDIDMCLDEQREDIVDFNALYWVAITTVDNYDEEENQPISAVINPLSVVPDPKNWRGSKMRFIWFERRLTMEYLESAPWFKDVDKIIPWDQSHELQQNDRASDNANWLTYEQEQDWLIDVYDHYTVFEWHKYLTTWANSRNLLIRSVKLEALTNAEKLNPSKIQFPVQIHRRKTMPWSFFWVSIADEVLQYQDIASQLFNLQIIQARQSALWPDKYVDSNLWIDISSLSKKTPWWRIIPVENNWWQTLANWVYTDYAVNPSQFPTQIINEVEDYSKQITWAWDIAFWNSPSWSQTKAEIQALMANSNQLLSAVWNNYIKWQRDYFMAHYRSYALNMWSKDKKIISLYQKWTSKSLELKKAEFIADWKVQVVVESENQVMKQNEKNSAKLTVIANLYLWNMRPWYSMNTFLRKLWDSQWIKWFDASDYIEKTVDEIKAERWLELLNRNEAVDWPQPWEDYRTFIAIYNQAIDTTEKTRALFAYEEALIRENEMNMIAWTEQIMWKWDDQSANMAMNSITQWWGEQWITSNI